MIDSVDDFLAQLGARLDQGAAEYGNQSFALPVAAIVDEVGQELLDEAGWLYVIWCVAARKCGDRRPEKEHREGFFHTLRHRLARNDRSHPDQIPAAGLRSSMVDIEVLCMDVFAHAQFVQQHLHRIARAIEVAQVMEPYENRGRRGSIRNWRSDD